MRTGGWLGELCAPFCFTDHSADDAATPRLIRAAVGCRLPAAPDVGSSVALVSHCLCEGCRTGHLSHAAWLSRAS